MFIGVTSKFCKQKRPHRVSWFSLRSTRFFLLLLFCLLLFQLPLVEQLDDDVFHLPGRVVARKVFPQSFVFDGHGVQFAFLFLVHNVVDSIVVKLALLCQLFLSEWLAKGMEHSVKRPLLLKNPAAVSHPDRTVLPQD